MICCVCGGTSTRVAEFEDNSVGFYCEDHYRDLVEFMGKLKQIVIEKEEGPDGDKGGHRENL